MQKLPRISPCFFFLKIIEGGKGGVGEKEARNGSGGGGGGVGDEK